MTTLSEHKEIMKDLNLGHSSSLSIGNLLER